MRTFNPRPAALALDNWYDLLPILPPSSKPPLLPVNFTALRRPSSLVEEVCQQLASLIRARDPARDLGLPGERVLAEKLGVSRTVVREATKKLEQQGMLKIQHGAGIKIVDELHRPLCGTLELLIPEMPERLRQLTQTRLCIEPAAARLAASMAGSAEVEKLLFLQHQLENAPDTASAVHADIATHRAIVEASGNAIFRVVLDSLAEIGAASRERTITRVGKAPAVAHHARIIAAIARRDVDEAEAAMRHHLLAAMEDLAVETAASV